MILAFSILSVLLSLGFDCKALMSVSNVLIDTTSSDLQPRSHNSTKALASPSFRAT